ncbi:MAG TPA: glycine--tRNA ligase subunit beta, partial [Porticoccus sp.]|nr:glycine--tRNA ligase subunit beta [Porticoccus sp.]
MSADFLVEIGTEELPPKALLTLSNAFRDEILSRLKAEHLAFGEVHTFATPRRLAVFIKALDEQAPTKEIVGWGAPVKVAFDAEGKPTGAAKAFAKKYGISVDELPNKIENDGKQDKLCHRDLAVGGFFKSMADHIVEDSLRALPIPKRMRWGNRREEFVRPIHWVVMLHGNEEVGIKVLGIPPGRTSRGHRFHAPGEIIIQSPSSYQDQLHQANVVVDFAERRELIRQGVIEAAENAGGVAVINNALLDEVTALNEWPVPLLGQFEERFLTVPSEALISSMAEHQKYFHVVDNNGQLLPMFITVANIESKDPSQVIHGN